MSLFLLSLCFPCCCFFFFLFLCFCFLSWLFTIFSHHCIYTYIYIRIDICMCYIAPLQKHRCMTLLTLFSDTNLKSRRVVPVGPNHDLWWLDRARYRFCYTLAFRVLFRSSLMIEPRVGTRGGRLDTAEPRILHTLSTSKCWIWWFYKLSFIGLELRLQTRTCRGVHVAVKDCNRRCTFVTESMVEPVLSNRCCRTQDRTCVESSPAPNCPTFWLTQPFAPILKLHRMHRSSR